MLGWLAAAVLALMACEPPSTAVESGPVGATIPACETGLDCTGVQQGFVCPNGACVQCKQDQNCAAYGQNYECISGRCQEKAEPDCTLGNDGCPCFSNGLCNPGFACNLAANLCEPIVPCSDGKVDCTCTTTDDCDAGLVCSGGVCATCPAGGLGCPCTQGKCGYNLACVDDLCVECEHGTQDCPCFTNGSCNDSLTCALDTLLCTPCTVGTENCSCDAEGECLGNELSCAEATNTCVPCEGVLGCVCDAFDECSPADQTECDPTTKVCEACPDGKAGCPCFGNGTCDECANTEAPCTTGLACNATSGKCDTCDFGTLGCACDTSCSDGSVCLGGLCAACPVGQGVAGCECTTAADCATGLGCTDGVCAACVLGTTGCQCFDGSTCFDGLACNGAGVCVPIDCPAGSAAGCACDAAGACTTDLYCDTTSGTCKACTSNIAGCDCTDGACGAGLTCLQGTCTTCNGEAGCACDSNADCSVAASLCDLESGTCQECALASAGCPCDGGNCGSGLDCVDGLCVTCTPGKKDCPCIQSDEDAPATCDEGLYCVGPKCTDCQPGFIGCPCVLPDYTQCPADCPTCQADCPAECDECDGDNCAQQKADCKATNACTKTPAECALDDQYCSYCPGTCNSGLTCDYDGTHKCVSCPETQTVGIPGKLGCACYSTDDESDSTAACDTDLVCVDGTCESCPAGTPGCPCDPDVADSCGTGLQCDKASETCKVCEAGKVGCPCLNTSVEAEKCGGYPFAACNATTNVCEACDIGADGTCLDNTEIAKKLANACGQTKICADQSAPAADGTCADGSDPTWNPNSGSAYPVVDIDSGACMKCPLACNGTGETGKALLTPSTLTGACMCETNPGYYWDPASPGVTQVCDADNDGWVRLSAKNTAVYVTDDTKVYFDPAIAQNFKCALRYIDRVVLETEWGLQRELTFDLEGFLYPFKADNNGYKDGHIGLFETDRNDDQAMLEDEIALQGTELPTAAGKRFPKAWELNPTTKFCATANGDYNDNGLADIDEVGAGATDKLWSRVSFFTELHTGEYQETSTDDVGGAFTISVGQYVIRERSRDPSATPDVQVPLQMPTGQDAACGEKDWDYWRYCARRPDSSYAPDNKRTNQDFAEFSFLPGKPPTPGNASSFFPGMAHHSQFQCVRTVPPTSDELSSSKPHLTTVDTLNNDGKYIYNRCTSDAPTAPAGTPAKTTFNCVQTDLATQVTDDEIGWVANDFRAYDDADEYTRGCVNECVELFKTGGMGRDTLRAAAQYDPLGTTPYPFSMLTPAFTDAAEQCTEDLTGEALTLNGDCCSVSTLRNYGKAMCPAAYETDPDLDGLPGLQSSGGSGAGACNSDVTVGLFDAALVPLSDSTMTSTGDSPARYLVDLRLGTSAYVQEGASAHQWPQRSSGTFNGQVHFLMGELATTDGKPSAPQTQP